MRPRDANNSAIYRPPSAQAARRKGELRGRAAVLVKRGESIGRLQKKSST